MQGAVSYTYIAPAWSGLPGLLQRSSDEAVIPLDLGNTDYQGFLAWIAAGNTAPDGWTGPTNPTGPSP